MSWTSGSPSTTTRTVAEVHVAEAEGDRVSEGRRSCRMSEAGRDVSREGDAASEAPAEMERCSRECGVAREVLALVSEGGGECTAQRAGDACPMVVINSLS